MKPVKVIVAGAGSRGMGYSQYALSYPERMKVIGVAEPREFYRDQMIRDHDISDEYVFTDWKDMAAREKFADAVIIATQDAMHVKPAVEFSNKGYAILLEKPMAPTAEGCKQIIQAVKENKILFAVAHVLRYTAFTRKLKEIIDRGVIGDVIGIDRVEPVGFWHMAHSFVRGNWRNEKESSFMLLAKSCHDIDWIHYMIGEHCKSISSFGSLGHFRPENAPKGSTSRCLDCPEAIESNCPYSAKRIYINGCLMTGHTGWPLDVITSDTTMEGAMDALRTGPYGRCVYHCDNDVVDHQVVNMEFENGKTATFTMMAFTHQEHRSTRIFGTRGEIKADGSTIEVYDFLTDSVEIIETAAGNGSILGGHGGGDFGLIHDFISLENKDSITDPALLQRWQAASVKVQRILQSADDTISLDRPVGDEENNELGDFIEDEDALEPMDAAARELLKEQVKDALSFLSDRERQVLELRFGLIDGKDHTLEEVSRYFNVTRERIRQIEAKALRKLRHPNRSHQLRDYLS